MGLGTGTTKDTRFYVLDASLTSEAPETTIESSPRSIGIGPITLPAYLDRPQIVSRKGANELHLAEFHRWAEPLKEGISRVLAEDLSRLLPSLKIETYPWKTPSVIDVRVEIEVSRFEAVSDGPVILDVSWRATGQDDRKTLIEMKSRYEEDIPSSGYDDIVGAMGRAVGGLGVDISAALSGQTNPR